MYVIFIFFIFIVFLIFFLKKIEKYVIYLKKFKNDDEVLKEKIQFRMAAIIEKYDEILENSEKEMIVCDEKIRYLIKNNQKEGFSFFIEILFKTIF